MLYTTCSRAEETNSLGKKSESGCQGSRDLTGKGHEENLGDDENTHHNGGAGFTSVCICSNLSDLAVNIFAFQGM